ncbi:MAG: peptidylprolyl isomerase [Clostridiales bacterium]|nr:peptidylprolyl isomerase [Clostridiales bacterium]
MDNGSKIVILLRPDQAPNTVASFIHLASLGCFDGHAIQRIVPGYVADMSYSAFGKEQAKYLIANESRNHGVDNTLPVEPGKICMGGYSAGIAGGEFFFPYAYHEKLQGNYPAFGEVLEGWEEVERWATVALVPVPSEYVEINRPEVPIVIRRVTVDCKGQEFPPPVKLEGAKLPSTWR